MTSKNERSTGQNRFKYRSFRELVEGIKTAVGSRSLKPFEEPNAEFGSFFQEGLVSWAELNLTKQFKLFRRAVLNDTRSLPLLLVNKDKVVKLLCENLQQGNVNSLEPFLNLTVLLANDLRQDFEPYIFEVLEIVLQLLKNKDAQIIQWVVNTLTLLLKSQQEFLRQQPAKVFHCYRFWLLPTTKCSTVIKSFIAESFAYLLRKVPSSILKEFYAEIGANQDVEDSLALVIFECVKHVQGKLHSKWQTHLTILKELNALSLLEKIATMLSQHLIEPAVFSEFLCQSGSNRLLLAFFGGLHRDALRPLLSSTVKSVFLTNYSKSPHDLELLVVILYGADLPFIISYGKTMLEEMLSTVSLEEGMVTLCALKKLNWSYFSQFGEPLLEQYIQRNQDKHNFKVLWSFVSDKRQVGGYKWNLTSYLTDLLSQEPSTEEREEWLQELGMTLELVKCQTVLDANIVPLLQKTICSLLANVESNEVYATLVGQLLQVLLKIDSKVDDSVKEAIESKLEFLVVNVKAVEALELYLKNNETNKDWMPLLCKGWGSISQRVRLITLQILKDCTKGGEGEEALNIGIALEKIPAQDLQQSRQVLQHLRALVRSLPRLTSPYRRLVVDLVMVRFRVNLSVLWPEAIKLLVEATAVCPDIVMATAMERLSQRKSKFEEEANENLFINNTEEKGSLIHKPGQLKRVEATFDALRKMLGETKWHKIEWRRVHGLTKEREDIINEAVQIYRLLQEVPWLIERKGKEQIKWLEEQFQPQSGELRVRNVEVIKLFGKLKKRPEMLEILKEALKKPDMLLQKAALQTIIVWDATLNANLLTNLLDDYKMGDALSALGKEEDLSVVIPLLYGRLISKKQRTKRGNILLAIAEMGSLALQELLKVMKSGESFTDERHQQGFIGLVLDMLKHLKTLLAPILSDLLQDILMLLSLPKSMSCLVGLFRLEFPAELYMPYINGIYRNYLEERLPRLAQEATQGPSALVELMVEWAAHPPFHPFIREEIIVPPMMALLTGVKVKTEVQMSVISFLQFYQPINNASLWPVITSQLGKVIKGSTEQSWEVRRQAIDVLAQLAELVTDPNEMRELLLVLLPLLKKSKSPDSLLKLCIKFLSHVELSQPLAVYSKLSSLFNVYDARSTRALLIEAVCFKRDQESVLRQLLNDLNAYSLKRLDEPDYDRRLDAFSRIPTLSLSSDDWLPVLHNCLFYLRSDDLALRNHAVLLLEHFITHLKEEDWGLLEHLILPGIKQGFTLKEEKLVQEHVALLGKMVTLFSDRAPFDALSFLLHEEEEARFFSNIFHIQLHRRARALRRFSESLPTTCSLSSTVLIFLQLFEQLYLHWVVRTSVGQEELLVQLIQAISSIANRLDSKQYQVLVNQYLEWLSDPKVVMTDKQTIRLVVKVLESLSESNATKLEPVIMQKWLPLLLKHSTTKEGELRTPLALAICKLCLLLKNSSHSESTLRALLLKVIQTLQSRSLDHRESARDTLAKILGLDITLLSKILGQLNSVLVKGFQRSVLSYSIEFLLKKCSPELAPNALDESFQNVILPLLLRHHFSSSEVEAGGKIKEARQSKKPYNLTRLIAHHLSIQKIQDFISALTGVLKEANTVKPKRIVEEVLLHLARALIERGNEGENEMLSFALSLLPSPWEPIEHFSLYLVQLLTKKDSLENLDNWKSPKVLETLGDRLLSTNFTPSLKLLVKIFARLGQCGVITNPTELVVVVNRLFELCSDSVSSELAQLTIQSLTIFIRHTKAELPKSPLQRLLELVIPELLGGGQNQVASFNLVQAVLSRRLVVQLAPLIEAVKELMVVSQSASIRQQARHTLLLYVLNYPNVPLDGFISFLLANLEHEYEAARLSVLDMLQLLVLRLTDKILSTYAPVLFLHLCLSVARDFNPPLMTSLLLNLKKRSMQSWPEWLDMLICWMDIKQPLPMQQMAVSVYSALIDSPLIKAQVLETSLLSLFRSISLISSSSTTEKDEMPLEDQEEKLKWWSTLLSTLSKFVLHHPSCASSVWSVVDQQRPLLLLLESMTRFYATIFDLKPSFISGLTVRHLMKKQVFLFSLYGESSFIVPELEVMMVKNLLFVASLAGEEGEEESDLLWMCKRLCFWVRSGGQTILKTLALRWLSGLAMTLDLDSLEQRAQPLLDFLYTSLTTADADGEKENEEVIAMVKQVYDFLVQRYGSQEFTQAYQRIRIKRLNLTQERREKRQLEKSISATTNSAVKKTKLSS